VRALGWVSSVVVGAALGATLGVLISAKVMKPARVVEAEEIRLVDASGQKRAVLGVAEGGWGLSLFGNQSKAGVHLSASSASGRALRLYNAKAGYFGVIMKLDSSGPRNRPRLLLLDVLGEVLWSAP